MRDNDYEINFKLTDKNNKIKELLVIIRKLLINKRESYKFFVYILLLLWNQKETRKENMIACLTTSYLRI